MRMKPELIVQQAKRENVDLIRRGLKQREGVIVLGIETKNFWCLAGLDALFLTLPRAEAWGSKPLPPHTCEVLRTREPELKKGFPPYVVTGVVMNDGEPFTGPSVVPLLVKTVISAVREFNARENDVIQTVGLMEVERFAPSVSATEIGELISLGYGMAFSQ